MVKIDKAWELTSAELSRFHKKSLREELERLSSSKSRWKTILARIISLASISSVWPTRLTNISKFLLTIFVPWASILSQFQFRLEPTLFQTIKHMIPKKRNTTSWCSEWSEKKDNVRKEADLALVKQFVSKSRYFQKWRWPRFSTRPRTSLMAIRMIRSLLKRQCLPWRNVTSKKREHSSLSKKWEDTRLNSSFKSKISTPSSKTMIIMMTFMIEFEKLNSLSVG